MVDKIKKFLESVFGPNWRTSISGAITLGAGAIIADPSLISFLPPDWQPTVSGIAKFIALVSGGTFVFQAKDRKVGGSGQAPSFYIDKDGAEVRRAEPVDDEEEKEVVAEPAPKSVTKSELKTMIQKLQ